MGTLARQKLYSEIENNMYNLAYDNYPTGVSLREIGVEPYPEEEPEEVEADNQE